MDFVKKTFFGFVFVIIFLCSTVVVSNLILKRPRLSDNDQHIIWIVNGKQLFIKSESGKGHQNVLIESNPTLRGYFSFLKNKTPGSFRIFCIGGSTTRGWPFNPHFSYPEMLSVFLQDLLPERRIEVINAGLCGSDSFSDVSIVREILNYQPDLLLIYEGRNDPCHLAYRMGVKSWVVKIHACLLRYVYSYSFLRNSLLQNNYAGFDHTQNIKEFLSTDFKCNNYLLRRLLLKNLKIMTNIAAQKECSIMLLTQVISCKEIQDKSVITEVNDWIRQFALENNIFLIDIDYAFRNSKKPMEDLIIPVSVHPDLEGYVLMAKTVCGELSRLGIIAPQDEWQWDNLKSDSQYFKRINLPYDFLSHVYKQLGDLCKIRMDMPELAKLYYKKGLRYMRNRSLPPRN